jgi:hypothetical protein
MKKIAVLLQRILPPLWCGMVLAIGFLEAPLKFKAPGVTREIGLSIGKLVFSALNAVECVLAVLLAAALFLIVTGKQARFVFGLLALILLLQTFWLIPALVERADTIIAGGVAPESATHIVYIVLEAGKVVLLLALSVLTQWKEISKPAVI